MGSVTQKMAERLIRAGADVNAKDRSGETPLYQSAMHSDIDLVHLLLANGADPNIRNNDGRTAYALCPPSTRDVLGEFEKKRALEERKMARQALGGSFRLCEVCRVGEKVMKRCTGCYLIWYCGRECQLNHWPEHQHDCKTTKLEYKTFFITDKQEKGKNHQTGKVFSRLSGDRPEKSHFVVKVLIESETLKVYSEDYLLYGNIIREHTPSEATEIKNKIEKEGDRRNKGFFYAIVPKNGKTKKNGVKVVEIKINTKKIQPIEGW